MKLAAKNGKILGVRAQEIAQRVRAALARHQPRGYRLIVDAEEVEHRGDEWIVVVKADRENAPLGDTVNRMMAAESDLQRRWKTNITLLPAMPPEDD